MKLDFSNFNALKGCLFLPAPGQVYADLAGELAILNQTTGIYYGLDPVGARIWTLIAEGNTVGEIRAILCDEYDVDGKQVEADLTTLLSDLQAKGLILVAPTGDVKGAGPKVRG
jgi:hypothetical protein